jgi:hypothetical protein
MCEGMWTMWPAPGICCASTRAAGSAFSGRAEASIAWM